MHKFFVNKRIFSMILTGIVAATTISLGNVIPTFAQTKSTGNTMSNTDFNNTSNNVGGALNEYSEASYIDAIMAIPAQNNKSQKAAMNYAKYFLTKSKYRPALYGGEEYPYKNNDQGIYYTTITDGKYTVNISGGAGCYSYCNFVSKVMYGADIEGVDQITFPGTNGAYTGANLKSTICKQLQMGEHIRIGNGHSVTFVSCDTKGLYYISYYSYLSILELCYSTYDEFAEYCNGFLNNWGGQLRVYNVNTLVNKNKPTAKTQTGLRVKRSSTGTTLKWSAIRNVEGYKIYRKAKGEKYTLLTTITDAATNSYEDTNLLSGNDYTYRINAYYGKFSTKACTAAITYYKEPQLYQTTVDGNTVMLTFESVAKAPKYCIYRRINEGKWKKYAETTNPFYIDTRVKDGNRYTYSVCVIQEDGTAVSTRSQEGISTYYFDQPVLTSVRNKASYISVNWTASEAAANYAIFRKTENGEWTMIGTTNKTSFKDRNVNSWTNYTYSVRVMDDSYTHYYSGMNPEGVSIYRQ